MKNSTFLFIALLFRIVSLSQNQVSNCVKDFDYLVQKIKNDYPGYNDKVSRTNKSQLLALENNLREKIKIHPDSCYYFLNQYTNFFKDYHLRISSVRKNSSFKPEISKTPSYGKTIKINADSLLEKTNNYQSLEGVWEGFREELAIVKLNESYIATRVNCKDCELEQVKYEFKPINDTLFDVKYHTFIVGKKPTLGKASLHLNGKVLEFHDDFWLVRKTNNTIQNQALLSSYIPSNPNGVNTFPLCMYLDDSTYYLRVSDFGSNTGNEFVKSKWNDITSRPNLIIDIRNNGGGQDTYYSELAKLIYTNPYESKGVEWYASKDNIKSFEDDIKNGNYKGGAEGKAWILSLVNAMKKNVGGFVTHPYQEKYDDWIRKDTVYPNPRHVGIIINDGNGSSAEQFLLAAKKSNKVLLFGNKNTAGVLDYSNITPNTLPSGNYQLWCPMTRSKRLPAYPIDNIGIAPDIIIPYEGATQLFNRLDDWVYFVKEYLELLK